MTSIIKVQLIRKVTVKSIISSGPEKIHHPLTFHAYSDTMKARIFESLIKPENNGKIAISFTDEKPRNGEWHEPLVEGSLINNFDVTDESDESDENISFALECFTKQYSLKEVLSKPQDFLGPNAEKVLEFWEKLDELTDNQWRKIDSKFKEIEDTSYIVKTIRQIIDTLNFVDDDHSLSICHELYGLSFTPFYACYISTGYRISSAVATFEIVRDVEDKLVLNMFDDL